MAGVIIDAENGIMGRIASFAAKQALLGNDVSIINSEKVLISGSRLNNIEKRKELGRMNTIKPRQGPFFSKVPEKMMKRCIRGMLPDFRQGKGKIALKRIKCYKGIPEEFKKEKMMKIENKKTPTEVITLEELGKSI